MKTQHIGIVITSPPHGSDSASQALDTALACAAFDQHVTVIFQDDGIWQLLPQPIASPLGDKSLLAQFHLMPLYGVASVRICRDSLRHAGIDASQLALNDELNSLAELKSRAELSSELTQLDQVWVY